MTSTHFNKDVSPESVDDARPPIYSCFSSFLSRVQGIFSTVDVHCNIQECTIISFVSQIKLLCNFNISINVGRVQITFLKYICTCLQLNVQFLLHVHIETIRWHIALKRSLLHYPTFPLHRPTSPVCVVQLVCLRWSFKPHFFRTGKTLLTKIPVCGIGLGLYVKSQSVH